MINSLFKKNPKETPFISLDIGSSLIKIVELDMQGEKPVLKTAITIPTPSGAVNNNGIAKQGVVAEVIQKALANTDTKAKHVSFVLPASSVFIKKVNTAYVPKQGLDAAIRLDAAKYIPFNINDVYFDYQVTSVTDSTMDIIIVAVKNDLIDSYSQTISKLGLIPAIADIETFSLENAILNANPQLSESCFAAVSIGMKHTTATIAVDGKNVITGNVGSAAKLYADNLKKELEMPERDVEQVRLGNMAANFDSSVVLENLAKTTEQITAQIQKQLGVFWSSAGTDKQINKIYLTGGYATSFSLMDKLSEKTSIECELYDPFQAIEVPSSFDSKRLDELKPVIGVGVGIAQRRLGDKIHGYNG